MPRRSTVSAFPLDAASALVETGRNLRTARLRRNLTLENVAARIGVHRETLASAEKGSPAVTMGTYVAALWMYGLLPTLGHLADPDADREGRALEAHRSRERARPSTGTMDNDF